jgi:AraC-like DNA-binding protein
MHLRRANPVAADSEFTVHGFSCLDDHTGWFGDYQDSHQIVLVRDGMFRVRRNGTESEVDPTVCYLGVPDTEEQFAHPACGEVCTVITLTPGLWRSMAGEAPLTRLHAYTTARMELAHRRMIAAAADPGYALTEQLLDLLAELLSQAAVHARRWTTSADRTMVDQARAAIAADDPEAARLTSLAGRLGVSPYRLSRVFHREVGVSLTQYRNRVRITRALARLEAGEPSLAALATDLGFADQAHLTRTVRDHLGHTPAALRRLLSDPRIPLR